MFKVLSPEEEALKMQAEMDNFEATTKSPEMPHKDALLEEIMGQAFAEQERFHRGEMTKEEEQGFLAGPKLGFMRVQRKADEKWVTILALELPGKETESEVRVTGMVPIAELLGPAAASDYHKPTSGMDGMFGRKIVTESEVVSGAEFLRKEGIVKTH